MARRVGDRPCRGGGVVAVLPAVAWSLAIALALAVPPRGAEAQACPGRSPATEPWHSSAARNDAGAFPGRVAMPRAGVPGVPAEGCQRTIRGVRCSAIHVIRPPSAPYMRLLEHQRALPRAAERTALLAAKEALLGQTSVASIDTNPLSSWSDKSCPCVSGSAWKGISSEAGSVVKV